jgi:protein-S-isoprenylcysteine O-methyltransferase Ste14
VLYIPIGVFGFLMAYVFDWLSLKQIPVVKQLAGIAAVCLLGYAIVMVCISPAKFELPPFTLPLGVCLLLISLSLLVYSLFIEIPFHSTYAGQRVSNKLITTGTYALVRHPGVIWLAFVCISLVLIFPSLTLLLATIVWIVTDIIYVFLQERFIFTKIFQDYPKYQKQTPFLIPNRRSFTACLKTIKPQAKTRD